MALIKEIELENGVVLNYHRISSLNKITNVNNTIEIKSYINKKQRQKEKLYNDLEIKNQSNVSLTEEEINRLKRGLDIYTKEHYINVPYDDSMTIEDAYNYLKTTDEYENAQDDIEV